MKRFILTLLLMALIAGPALSQQPAEINYRLPAGASLSIAGQPVAVSGTSGKFITSPLASPGELVFEVTANGKTWKKIVPVQSGGTAEINLEESSADMFGVDFNRIKPGTLTCNGQPITREKASQLVEESWRPSDKNLPFLVIIGPADDCKKVMEDLKDPKLAAEIKGKWRVQEYRPDEWAVKDVGFVTTGKPTIIMESAAGKVLHRQDSYKGIESLFQTLRKANPEYKNQNDPDLTKPALISGNYAVPLGAFALLIAVVALGKKSS